VKLAQIFDVKGNVAFVTGAASGLGLAYAEAMAENGAKTVLADMDEEGLEKVVARLRAAGCEVEPAVVDVTDAEGLRAAIDAAAARHGRLDIVFANAGISSGPGFSLTPDGGIERIDPEVYRRVLDVNLTSVLHTVQFAATIMKRQKRGSIVVTGSIAGMHGELYVGYPYIVTKAAVHNLVRQAALELAPFNVRVNAVAPGPFLTNIRGGVMRKDPEVRKHIAATVPLGRVANTDEIKGLALLLASSAGSFITGAVIPIDGGVTAGG
jgi:NAD(P)-dependent dehydrogenase (short-subunit alcohol dehydrogenase family)